MKRLNQQRQEALEPERMKYAKDNLEALGYEVTELDKELRFFFRGQRVILFPYSGWHSGKSIKAGRGLQKLLDQLND